MARMTKANRDLRRALRFTQCASCSFDFATGEGDRSCHYYECPYLPETLSVVCPTCSYNFYTQEGATECTDPPSCAFAVEEAPIRLRALRSWLAQEPL